TAEADLTAHLGGTPALRGTLAGCDLTQVRCVWHRRPSEPAAGDPLGAAELRAALGGVLASLPHLNHPVDMAAAALKPYQLAAAAGESRGPWSPPKRRRVRSWRAGTTARWWSNRCRGAPPARSPGRTAPAGPGRST